MEIWGYLGAIAMGLILGLIGGGGSILSVPVLVYCFRVHPAVATFYSLAIVGTSALFGVIPYARRHRVEYRSAFAFLIPSLLGLLFSRRVLLPTIPAEFSVLSQVLTKDALILGSFGVVMLAASSSMIWGRSPSDPKADPKAEPSWLLSTIMGAAIGSVVGFVGAGGGFVIVPVLVIGLRIPIERAIGTSLLIIGLTSLVGFLGESGSGVSTDWGLILRFIGLALIGVAVGTRASGHISTQKLKVAFGWFVMVVGSAMLIGQIV